MKYELMYSTWRANPFFTRSVVANFKNNLHMRQNKYFYTRTISYISKIYVVYYWLGGYFLG